MRIFIAIVLVIIVVAGILMSNPGTHEKVNELTHAVEMKKKAEQMDKDLDQQMMKSMMPPGSELHTTPEKTAP